MAVTNRGGGSSSIIDSILAKFEAAEAQANAANEQRYQEGLAIYDQIIESYQPGGAFEQATLSQLDRTKEKTLARGTQDLISSGLYNTSVRASQGSKFEEDIGAPTRLKMQDLQLQRLGGALGAKAGFIERRSDIGPDFSSIASLAAEASSATGRGFRSNVSGGHAGGISQGFFGRGPSQSFEESSSSLRSGDFSGGGGSTISPDYFEGVEGNRIALSKRAKAESLPPKPKDGKWTMNPFGTGWVATV